MKSLKEVQKAVDAWLAGANTTAKTPQEQHVLVSMRLVKQEVDRDAGLLAGTVKLP